MRETSKCLVAMSCLIGTVSGCATVSTFQRADSLGSGGYAIGIEPGFYGAAGSGGAAAFPDFSVSARFGVSDRADLGVRVGSPGIEFLTKYQFTEPGKDGVVLSIAPSAGGFVAAGTDGGGGAVGFQVPLLIGIPTIGNSQFVLGPKVHYIGFVGAASGSSAGVGIFSIGSSFGYDVALSPVVHLLPEVAMVYPLFGHAGSDGGGTVTSGIGDGLLFQAGMAIDLGRMEPRGAKKK